MKKPITNVGASVRARLLNESKRRQANFQHVLQRYAAERFCDVHVLRARFACVGESFSAAISATSRRRATAPVLETPVALTPAFYQDVARALQWRRYLERGRFKDAPTDFGLVGESIQAFLGPPLSAATVGRPFALAWPAGGPWR